MLAETPLKGPDRRPAWASDAGLRSANMTKSCKSSRFERQCAAYRCIIGVLQYGMVMPARAMRALRPLAYHRSKEFAKRFARFFSCRLVELQSMPEVLDRDSKH